MVLALNLTFGGKVIFWIFIVLAILAAFAVYLFYGDYNERAKRGLAALITLILSVAVIYGVASLVSWYNTNTANGQRAIKNDVSNMTGGLDRKVTIIFYGKEDSPIEFEGKIDLRTTEDQKVLEFILDGKKYIYYVGILDRYIVEEK